MSAPERKRITVALPLHVFHQLELLAAQRNSPYGTVANELLCDLLLHGALPSGTDGDASPAARPRPTAAGEGEEGELPGWLEMDRGRPWRAEAWTRAQQLRTDYARELHRLPADWTEDRFARDGLLALAEWRGRIDAGASAEPTVELAWLDSLRRYAGWLDQRARENPDNLTAQAAPDDWTTR
ncbi:hypothetical protein GKE82_26050 [Conexibacter sp. W3-3-2]|uniref:hypothetical protein n=1 Tax=Conexibacter sp. W3-3-2 TaxID=2675227 RepID=UPI0012B8724B|nr:hypothetical protein [Conexibacter sp. W3-3-2]MTD47668.1 hypothetical protein [Conexibacter sp. W3-3-2]